MSWIILKQSHPLDRIWEAAVEAVSDADHAMDALGSDFTDEQLDAAGARRTEAIMTVIALPSRNPSDSLYKLDLAGVDSHGSPRTDCDLQAIMNEAIVVLDAAVARGAKLKRDIPDLLEGVAL